MERGDDGKQAIRAGEASSEPDGVGFQADTSGDTVRREAGREASMAMRCGGEMDGAEPGCCRIRCHM